MEGITIKKSADRHTEETHNMTPTNTPDHNPNIKHIAYKITPYINGGITKYTCHIYDIRYLVSWNKYHIKLHITLYGWVDTKRLVNHIHAWYGDAIRIRKEIPNGLYTKSELRKYSKLLL